MNQVSPSLTLRAPPNLRWTYLAVAVHCPRRLIRDALVAWLNRAAFQVVGQVSDVAALADLCGLRRPNLVIVDAGSDVMATLESLADLRSRFPQTRIVVIHDELAPADLAGARRAGLGTLIPSSVGLESLFRLLHGDDPVASSTEPAAPVMDEEMTDLEREVLGLLGAGHSIRRIATMLDATVSTVETSKRRIYAKLRVETKGQAIARAVGRGLVDPLEAVTSPASDRSAPPGLTAREFDILRSIALGHTVRQTARLLSIAEKTVENLQARLFLKLGTHNRAGTIRTAYALGLLEPESQAPTHVDPLPGPSDRA